MIRACSARKEIRNAYKILVGQPEGKRPLRRPRRRWKDNIETGFREIGLENFACSIRHSMTKTNKAKLTLLKKRYTPH
jgi:hypothetical protein